MGTLFWVIWALEEGSRRVRVKEILGWKQRSERREGATLLAFSMWKGP